MSRYVVRLWLKQMWNYRTFLRLFESFGIMWLMIEVTAFFSPEVADQIRPLWWLFVTVGLLVAGYQSWPRLRRRSRLRGRDVIIEIVVEDIFDLSGNLVIGTNTSFDTDMQNGIISPKSIQGKFTRRYFPNLDVLNREISSQVDGLPFQQIRKKGRCRRYDIGTVCSVATSDFKAYFLAIAHINSYGNAEGSYQYVRDALPALWDYIAQKGDRESLRVPVLGTGFSRINEPRQKVIKEIVRSFIAACSEQTFCEHLIICIHGEDFFRYSIDLDDLGRFLELQCEYTEFVSPNTQGVGTPIDWGNVS